MTNWKVLYNIGSCYFKLDQPLAAKIHYLRARKFQPLDPSIARSIAMVNKRFKDAIVPETPDFISRAIEVLQAKLSLNALSLLLLAAVLLLNIFLFLLLRRGRHKKIVYGLAFSLILCLALGAYHYRRGYGQRQTSTAVVSAAEYRFAQRSGRRQHRTVQGQSRAGSENSRPQPGLGPGRRLPAGRRLDRVEASDPDLKKTGLYIHFPFCRRACFYCHFFKKKFQAEKAHSWLRLACREIAMRSDADILVDTVYLGGGSPSLLDPGQVAALLEAAAKHFRLSDRAEVTLEANPEDLSLPLLEELRSAGINRLSIGVQSFQEKDLRCLRRNHSAAQATHAVEMALGRRFRKRKP